MIQYLARRGVAAVALLVAFACRDATEPPHEPPATPLALSVGLGDAPFAVALGTQTTLPVRLRGARGDSLPLPASFTLVSRNSAVVSIDSGTVIQGRAMGSAWVVGSVTIDGRTVADSVAIVVLCTAELRVEITPQAQTLTIGESFTPTVRLSGCGGRLTLNDTLRWSADDPTVIRVDSTTGLTTGLQAGRSSVYAYGLRYGAVAVVPVTVASRPQ